LILIINIIFILASAPLIIVLKIRNIAIIIIEIAVVKRINRKVRIIIKIIL